MSNIATVIDAAWEKRADISAATKGEVRDAVNQALAELDSVADAVAACFIADCIVCR